MIEERLINIETKISYQEDLIEELVGDIAECVGQGMYLAALAAGTGLGGGVDVVHGVL